MNSTKNQKIILYLVLLFTFLTFSPSFFNDFTNWDDNEYIVKNNYIKTLNFDGLKVLSSKNFMGNYHPLTMFSLALDYQISGKLTWMFHFSNLLFHILSTYMVFIVVFRLYKNFFVAIVATALWGMHPLHVESVVWMSERKDVLYVFFYLLSVYLYLRYDEQKKRRFYYYSLVIFLLSLLSKGQAVTLSVTLVLIDYLKEKKFDRQLMMEKVPYFVLSMVFGIITILSQQKNILTKEITNHDFFERIVFACYSLTQYIFKIFVPINLSAFYPYPVETGKVFFSIYLLFLILGILFIYLIYWALKTSRALSFALLFFMVNIVLLLQILPVGMAVMADRYTYLSSLGIFILIAFLCKTALDKKMIKQKYLNIIIVTCLLALSLASVSRTRVWKDSLTLWNNAVERFPGSAIALINRGASYNELGMYEEAIRDFDTVISIDPDNEKAFYNRGLGKFKNKNDLLGAMDDYNRAIFINPNYYRAYVNRSKIKGQMKDFKGAVDDAKTALKIKPGDEIAYTNMGLAYMFLNRTTDALNAYNRAIKINPNYDTAYLNRSHANYKRGDLKSACKDLKKAAALGNKKAISMVGGLCPE